jgi:hypothetical protein
MLLLQRLRKHQRQYGIYVVVTVTAVLLLVLWKLSSLFAHVFASPRVQVSGVLHAAWIAWLAVGIGTGRDFTWHIRIERLTTWRISLFRLYVLDLALSFAAYPMLLLFSIFAFFGLRHEWTIALWLLATIALVGFVLLTRMTISIARTIVYRRVALMRRQWRIAGTLLVLATASVFALPSGSAAALAPISNLAGAVPHGSVRSVLILAIEVLVLSVVDYSLQRRVIRSGLAQSVRLGAGRKWGSRFLLSASLFRITVLGWLRNPNVVLLFLWGVTYGFVFTYLRPPRSASDVLLFTWMVLIFHSYVRGNLLGVDHRAAWLYYRLPTGIAGAIAAKNRSLNLLQVLMVGAVLLPLLLRPIPGISRPFEWACVLSFGISGILIGAFAGGIFSLLHPEPIERGAMYSGAMTLGAFIIPGLQLVLVVGFLYLSAMTGHGVPLAVAWALYIGLPLALAVLCWRALPVILSTLAVRHKESILGKLGTLAP